jgi:signal transduction histidine kinase
MAGFGFGMAVVVAVVAAVTERTRDRARFEASARETLSFVEGAGLPGSVHLARRMSEVLGVGVAFRRPDGGYSVGPGDRKLWEMVLDRVGTGSPGARMVFPGGWEAVAAEGAGEPGVRSGIVLLRRAPGWNDVIRPGTWIAVGLVPLGALVPALALARHVVTPLRRMRGWLPRWSPDEAAGLEDGAEPPEDLLRRADEIGALARALAETRRRLAEETGRRRESERLALFGAMASSLAHEIKNPASAIRLHAGLWDAAEIGTEGRESLAAIQGAADRIIDLVHQWLFVVRAEPPRLQAVDLADVVAAAVNGTAELAAHHGARVTWTAASVPMRVWCDPLRLEHAVRNLLSNAFQAMPEGGTVEIAWLGSSADGSPEGGFVVRDGGIGFTAEGMARYGEPFFSTREGGMGLGTSLVREVVQAVGGSVTARNRTDVPGAEVAVRLPVDRGDLAGEEAA